MTPPDSSAVAIHAYNTIRQRIIGLTYPPGMRLSEARLAEELGVGRSPVRTAFARLKSDGWIDITPQSGTYVKRPSEEEIREIFEFRLLLETHVTKLAAQNMSQAELQKLRKMYKRLTPEAGAEADSFDDFNELDSLFHASIYGAANNGLMTGALFNLLDKVKWLKKYSPTTPGRMGLWFQELGSLLEALEARDPELAAQRMSEHIGNAADFAAAAREQMSAHAKGGPEPVSLKTG
jgi:GntR family transcriptional regulator, rspAB operon transcriptional repressor